MNAKRLADHDVGVRALCVLRRSARLYGGRWNPKGVPIVYTAASQSLAMLEMWVQDQPARARYVIIEVRIPAGVVIDRVATHHLPSDWREISAPEKTAHDRGGVGEKKRSRAVLAVTSAIVPPESNNLLNPLLQANQNWEARDRRDDLRLIKP